MTESPDRSRRFFWRIVFLSVSLVAVVAAYLAWFGGFTSGTRRAPHLLLVTGDTLRHDRLGYHGADGGASPSLDRLARTSYQFAPYLTASNNTNVSFASLHTGTYMRTHGVEGLAQLGYPLEDRFDTLAEILRAAGYTTVAAVSAPVLDSEAARLAQGFDVYLDCGRQYVKQPAEVTNRRLFEALDGMLGDREPSRPLFVWVHYFDPHWPYRPPEPFGEMFAVGVGDEEDTSATLPRGEPTRAWEPGEGERRIHAGRYAGEVRYLDREIGELLSGFRRRGLLDDSLVVFTADHGENLGEHDGLFANHQRLYRPVSETSLLVRLPGQSRGEILPAGARTVDVLPTCLDLLGIRSARPEGLEGDSLAPWIRNRGGTPEAAFSEGAYQKEKSVLAGRHRLTYRLAPFDLTVPGFELYDVEEDPGETRDRFERDGEASASLRERLRAFMGAPEFRVRIASRDGAPHVVEGWIRPWKASVVRVEGRDLEAEDSAEPSGDGAVRFRCSVRDGDSDELVAAVDESGTVGLFVRVDGRPVTLDEVWFVDFERAATTFRYLVLLDPAAPARASGAATGNPSVRITCDEEEGPAGARAWRVRIRVSGSATGAGGPGAPGAPSFEARVFASTPLREVRPSPDEGIAVTADEDRLRFVLREGAGDGAEVSFLVAAEPQAMLLDLRGPDGLVDPSEVVLGRGCRVPGEATAPGILYSPRLQLSKPTGGAGVLGERADVGAVRLEVTSGSRPRGGAGPLDPELETRLRELGYIGDGNRQN
jgi:arylsulfatase A-like enzyme